MRILEVDADGPYVLRLEGWLLADEFPLVFPQQSLINLLAGVLIF